ncbi:MAG: hypothetical protein FWC29_00640 [Methanomassiliicoccaceae archaeon]|nr:hypothetical protein [Methanomassiliicoccaceae archaeon]
MKMRFQRMRYNNICNFKDFDISFKKGFNHISVEKDKDLTDIIKIILSGRQLGQSEIQSLRPNDESIKDGFAELILEIDTERYAIRLDLDYVAKKSLYHVTSRKDNGVPRPMVRTPSKCRIEKNVLDMMVLKKEDVERLFEKGSAYADAVIYSAAGIDKLKLIEKKAQTICEDEVRRYDKPLPENKGVNRQNTLLNKYKLVEMNLERYRDELHVSIAAIKKEQNSMIGRMGWLVRKIVESRLDELCLNQNLSETDVEDMEEIIFALRYPPFFSQQISGSVRRLQSVLEDIKCPIAPIPRPIMDIASSGICVCGTEVDDTARENITRAVERYSMQHPYFMINEVRKSIDSFSDGTLFNYYLGKSEMEASVKALKDMHQNKPSKSKILETTMLPEITMTAQTIKDLKKQIDNLESDMFYLTDMRYNDDPKSNIPACRRKIRSISLSIDNADFAHELRVKTEIFLNIIDEIYRAASAKAKDKLLSSMNSDLSSIFGNDFFIEDINGCLIFNGGSHNRDTKGISGLIFINTVLKSMGMDLPILLATGPNEIKQIQMPESLFQQMIIVRSQPRGDSVAI